MKALMALVTTLGFLSALSVIAGGLRGGLFAVLDRKGDSDCGCIAAGKYCFAGPAPMHCRATLSLFPLPISTSQDIAEQ